MTAARKLTPPPPASCALLELRARSVRLLDRVAVEVRAMRDEADTRRDLARGRYVDMDRRAADRLEAGARELDVAADELRWLASLGDA